MAETQSSLEAFTIDTTGAVQGGVIGIPVDTFITEMEGKASLLIEHTPYFMERLFFDSRELATRVMVASKRLRDLEDRWHAEAASQDSEIRFWFGNKSKLYKLNQELHARLTFKFKRENDQATLAELADIGASSDDSDAISDGRRNAAILRTKRTVVTTNLYSPAQVDEMLAFYDHIDKARTASLVDRTSPNSARIDRDHAYLALVELDHEIAEAADACFVHEPHIRAQYVSAYKRSQWKKYNRTRTEKQKAEQAEA